MTKRSRIIRFAAPLVIVLLGLVGYDYGYERVHTEMAALREMQASKVKTLQKYVTIIAEKPGLESKLAALKEKRKEGESKIIAADTPALAANSLDDTVKAIIMGRGGTISSERVEKAEDLGKFKIVNVTMDLVLPDTKALTDILYNIETRTPYIVIKELDTRVRNFREPRDLMVKLRVSALTGGK